MVHKTENRSIRNPTVKPRWAKQQTQHQATKSKPVLSSHSKEDKKVCYQDR